MNAVVTVNVFDLLTYLEGPHIHDDSPAPRSHEDSHENRIPNRIQADVCCIVDVSGSMKTKAQSDQYEDASGNMVDDGMTVLHITKHAVKAVMQIPEEDDRVTIVTFRSNANVVFPSTKMCEIGRSTGLDFLASLQPGGTTNIWHLVRHARRLGGTPHMRGRRPSPAIPSLADGRPTGLR